MLDSAQGCTISGNPSFTHVEGNVTIQTSPGVVGVVRSRPGVASSSSSIWDKLMRWTPENACKVAHRRLNETLDILEDFQTIIPYKTLKMCQEEERILRNEYKQIATLVDEKSLGSYLINRRLRARLTELRTNVNMLHRVALEGSQHGRSQNLQSYVEQLEKMDMSLAADSNDQLFTGDDQSSSDTPPPDDPDEGYDSDGSFATCRTKPA